MFRVGAEIAVGEQGVDSLNSGFNAGSQLVTKVGRGRELLVEGTA